MTRLFEKKGNFVTYFKTVSSWTLILCGHKYIPCLVSASFLYLLICQTSVCVWGGRMLACGTQNIALSCPPQSQLFLKLKKSQVNTWIGFIRRGELWEFWEFAV